MKQHQQQLQTIYTCIPKNLCTFTEYTVRPRRELENSETLHEQTKNETATCTTCAKQESAADVFWVNELM